MARWLQHTGADPVQPPDRRAKTAEREIFRDVRPEGAGGQCARNAVVQPHERQQPLDVGRQVNRLAVAAQLERPQQPQRDLRVPFTIPVHVSHRDDRPDNSRIHRGKPAASPDLAERLPPGTAGVACRADAVGREYSLSSASRNGPRFVPPGNAPTSTYSTVAIVRRRRSRNSCHVAIATG